MLDYARTRNVTKIVVGKPARPRWQEMVFGSTVDELVRRSGEIDVYVISGEPTRRSAPARCLTLERTSSNGRRMAGGCCGGGLHRAGGADVPSSPKPT